MLLEADDVKQELDNFVIESNLELDYFFEVVNYIKEKEKNILEFFDLDKLPNKVTILILSYKPFKNWIVSKYGEILDYISGDSDSETNCIRLLNIEDQKKYTRHKNADVDDIKKTVVHEIVHQCHHLYHKDYRQITWFSEGLAKNLANQGNKPVNLDDCDFIQLKNDFRHYEGNYGYASIIVNYILNNYSKEEIKKFYSDPDYLRSNADRLFNEAKEYVIKKKNIY